MPSNQPATPPSHPRDDRATDTPVHNLHDEADIGSGERSPGQDDTDAAIRQVPVQPPSDAKPAPDAPKP